MIHASVSSRWQAARRHEIARYGIALLAVLFVTILKVHVEWIGRDAPGAVYLGAVMFVAWFGGVGPGLLATGLSFLFGAYFFSVPYNSLAIASADEAARLTIVSAEGALIALLAGALRKRNDELQGEMRERTIAQVALRRASEQVLHTQKMRTVGELASGIAHDFNNMVTIVLTCVDLLERKLPSDHAARVEVAEIRAAIERAAALAKQLLTLARRREGTSKMIDVHEVLTRIEPIVARVVGPSVHVERQLQATRSRIRADVVQLEQAIVNLASNARDAMPSGGTLTIATTDLSSTRCGAEMGTPDPHLEISIRDSGVGMDEQTRAHVFEPFFTTKAIGSGTGLGLWMVFGIVGAIGGVVRVESEPGHGATFRLLLPIADSP